MVTIYPMLISQAVSENVIPGIAKTLESYIIVYNMNDVLSNPTGPRQVNYKIKGGRIFAKESEDLSEGLPPGVKPGTKGKGQPQLPELPDEEDEEEKEKEKEKISKEKSKVNLSDRGITLEPTYMTVEVTKENGQQVTEFIGVKVVPLRVKSDAKLLDMMMYDQQMRFIQALMVKQGRNILRFAYKIIGKWTGRLGSKILGGDVRQDAILGRSGFRGQPFIVVDKGQDFDESFFSKPSKINRLFKMGWGNIIIVDSINRQAYFCLKQLRGTCSILSFSMIYQNLGQLKVYETLEDAKRQNSSLFKMGPKISRVLGERMSELKQDRYILSEGKHMDKIDTYLEQLNISEDLELLEEADFKALAKKLVPDVKLKGVVSKLKSSFDIKKPEKIIKAVKAINIPIVKPKTIDKIIGSKIPGYSKNKATAKVILKNSMTGAKETSLDAAASFIALQSMFKKKGEKDDPKGILKNNIKQFVLRARKFQSEYEAIPEEKRVIPKDVLVDYVLGATIVVLALGFVTLIGSGLYVVITTVAAGISALLFPGLAIAVGSILGAAVIAFAIYAVMFIVAACVGAK